MLNWLVCYLNYNGYYFYDSNNSNVNYYGVSSYECNYNASNYQQQPNAATPRKKRNRDSKRNDATTTNANNRQNQLEAEKRRALEATNLKKGLETKIEETNKGYEMLKKMGYENGKGLGRNAEGMLEPLTLELKSDRKGLGATVTSSKTASGKLSKKQRKKLRRKEAGEVAAQKSKQQAATVVSNKVAVTTSQQAQKVDPQIVAKKAIGVASQPVEKSLQSPEVTKKPVDPALPLTVATLPVKTVATLTTATTKSSDSTRAAKVKFSVKDPCTPEFLHSLRRTFNEEIELMQLRLTAEASLNDMNDETDFIIAKIYIDNNPNVGDHVFEFIRTELVGWIGVYQQEGLDTPIFHCIANNGSHITLVCENTYAFGCLERCIEDIVQMKTLDSLKVVRLPSITTMIYCYEAVYEGIASDTELFLSQLHLHKPKLYTDNWMVASQEVCAKNRKTFFIFLIDERSALALNFHYSSSFFVCMQQVTFRNRGVVSETISK